MNQTPFAQRGRWEHPSRALIYPDAFLPPTEQAGLMGAMAEQILEESLGAAQSWRSAGHDVHVAVNLSASDLSNEALPSTIKFLSTNMPCPQGRSSWRSPRAS